MVTEGGSNGRIGVMCAEAHGWWVETLGLGHTVSPLCALEWAMRGGAMRRGSSLFHHHAPAWDPESEGAEGQGPRGTPSSHSDHPFLENWDGRYRETEEQRQKDRQSR